MFRRVDTCDAPKHKLLTIELRDVVREYRIGGQTVRALDEIRLR
ncbi:ABC transporter ATP-binding protein [Mycobacterium ahvazicum]|uniref:ABC transporter ATP-binding protein n=1 Tax=Mycobacterium ahvazicum TaxID=1964395 RepID=A0A2K4YBC1_9MYCO|nr:ABC transporter ATP-binding protein [Mycobacterium ahvazicum]